MQHPVTSATPFRHLRELVVDDDLLGVPAGVDHRLAQLHHATPRLRSTQTGSLESVQITKAPSQWAADATSTSKPDTNDPVLFLPAAHHPQPRPRTAHASPHVSTTNPVDLWSFPYPQRHLGLIVPRLGRAHAALVGGPEEREVRPVQRRAPLARLHVLQAPRRALQHLTSAAAPS
jgi:hypothetical protein